MPHHAPASRPEHGRIFYGWRIVYALCLVSTTTAGLAFYNISVLLDAFVSERGFSVGLAGIATGLFFAASGIAGVLAGYLIERFDARRVMVASGCASALALACIGMIHEPWQLYAFYIAFGFCYGGCGLVPTSTVVARWFHVGRARALAIASTGLSLGGIVATPLSALLIKQLGLSGAAPWLALMFFLGVVPPLALVVRARPQDMGLYPDGFIPAADAAGPPPRGWSFSDAWRSPFFLAVTGAYMFALGAQVGAFAHVFRLANVRANASVGAAAVALLAATSLLGRLASGRLLEVFPLRAFAIVLIASQTVTLALLAYATSAPGILAAAGLIGLTAGSILMMQQLLLADAFGTRDYGRIYAVSILFTVPGVAGGPALMGLINEASGGYTASFLAAAAASFLGFAVLAFAKQPKP